MAKAGTAKKTTKKRAKKAPAKKAVVKRAPANHKARATVAANKRAAKKVAPKKRAKRRAKPNGSQQKAFLAQVLEESPGITSQELAAKYKILDEDVMKMRHFVHEYIKDFKPVQAALRMGYDELAAVGAAKMMMMHSFTQLRLGEVQSDLDANSLITGNQVLFALWKEANLGETAANAQGRISALKELARIKQMGGKVSEKPVRVAGVMLVPLIEASGVSSWEDKAKASQAALKQGSIDV